MARGWEAAKASEGMQFAGAEALPEGSGASGMFGQHSGFHGQKSLVRRSVERRTSLTAFAVPVLYAEV